MLSIRNPPKNDGRRVIIERKATGKGMNPRKSSRFQHECSSDPGLLRVYMWPLVTCYMCSSGLYLKVKSLSLDYQANFGHQSVAFDQSGMATSLSFFLNRQKKKKNTIGFQCFILWEKFYLRTRLHLMLFCFLFLFFALGSTPDSISSPHCSHPPSE